MSDAESVAVAREKCQEARRSDGARRECHRVLAGAKDQTVDDPMPQLEDNIFDQG